MPSSPSKNPWFCWLACWLLKQCAFVFLVLAGVHKRKNSPYCIICIFVRWTLFSLAHLGVHVDVGGLLLSWWSTKTFTFVYVTVHNYLEMFTLAPVSIWWLLLCFFYSHSDDRWTLGITNDWQLLSRERLWCGWVPVVIHLIARGLHLAMATLVFVIGRTLACCCQGRRWRGVVSWILMVVSLPFLCVCSGVSLLLFLVAFMLQVSNPFIGAVVNTQCWWLMLSCG